jgi:hypothetical protein
MINSGEVPRSLTAAPPFPIRRSCSSAAVASERRLLCWSDPTGGVSANHPFTARTLAALRRRHQLWLACRQPRRPSGSWCAAMRRGGDRAGGGTVRGVGVAVAVRCGRPGRPRPVQRLRLVRLPVTLARSSLPDGGSADGATGNSRLSNSWLRPPRGHGSVFRWGWRLSATSTVSCHFQRFGSRRNDRSVSLARSAAYSWTVRRSRPPRPGPWIGASSALPVEVLGLVVNGRSSLGRGC